MRRAETDRVAHAIADLRGLAQVGRGVLERADYGTAAVPHLRALLFAPEPSGLFQSRCGAVEALAALGADDVLIEFLSAPYATDDPVARAGTKAVMNAAARALIPCGSSKLPRLLLRLAEEVLLPGAIEWLGAHECIEALPCLIRALGDDFARPSAMSALHALGERPRGALCDAVLPPGPNCREENDTIRRRRRAALRRLRDHETGAEAVPVNALRALADERDIDLSGQGLRWLLDIPSSHDLSKIVDRLRAARDRADLLLRYNIDACLGRHGWAQIPSREGGAWPGTEESVPSSAAGLGTHSNLLGLPSAANFVPAAGMARPCTAAGAAR